MVLRKTVHSEIPELTRISKAAFDTDNLVGDPETGGPPDYDSELWYAKMIEGGLRRTVPSNEWHATPGDGTDRLSGLHALSGS